MEWLIVLIVVVALAAVVALALTQRRSVALRRRFGPEYERLLAEENGDRRAVETRLRERQKRRDALDIRALPPEACEAYAEQWRETQLHFVDDPVLSLADAGGLVEQVARQRGYPVDDGDEGIEMVSVDHPRLIGHYRAAQAVDARAGDETVPLDDIRSAFRCYRALFNELLRDEQAPRRRLASSAATAREAG
jgi:hypothetical protein